MRWMLLSLALLGWTNPVGRLQAQEAPRLGSQVGDFRLEASDGQKVSLYGFAGAPAAVLVFTGVECPLGNLYIPRLNELAKKYEAQGVVFLAIDSNASAAADAVAAHAREHEIAFPVLLDPDQRVADSLGVDRTCTAIVLDGRARLRYRGPIDDQYTYTTRRPAPTQNYLASALDSVLAGKTPEAVDAEVFGCPIQRAEKPQLPRSESAPEPIPAPEPVDVGEVTYHKDVAPILQAKCQGCHRPGQVGPFALMSFADAKRWAASIDEVVTDGRMPPWHADPRHGSFSNDRSLSPRERSVLLAWVDQGKPEGNPADAPAPRTYPDGPWTLGPPDVVFSLPEPFTVPVDGEVRYQYYRVPTHFTEDKYIRAAEVLPTERSVVHHVLVFVFDPTNPSALRDAAGGGQLTGYVPGDEPQVFPAGSSKKIPAGSILIFQVHYTPTGKKVTDQTQLALYFADTPTDKFVETVGINNKSFVIPPGDPAHRVEATYEFPVDATLLTLWPHMHVRGKAFQYKALYPDGSSETLLSVPRYDFNWQTGYVLAEPKRMPKGTQILCEAWYDNSKDNLNNPDPSESVRWGDQTREEMMIGYIDFIPDQPLPAPPLPEGAARLRERLREQMAAGGGGPLAGLLGGPDLSPQQRVDRIFRLLDRDQDGRIQASEFPAPAVFPRLDLDANGSIDRSEAEKVISRMRQ